MTLEHVFLKNNNIITTFLFDIHLSLVSIFSSNRASDLVFSRNAMTFINFPNSFITFFKNTIERQFLITLY
jgi:hypothetical protein